MSLNKKTVDGRIVLASNGDVLVGGKDYEVYSENETMIGYWKDGKPIYRKVITTLQFPKVTVDDGKIKAKNYDISELNVDTMITSTMSQIWGDYNAIRFNMINPLPTFIQVATNAITSSEAAFTFTIEYTKTTDTPVQDTNTYSTEEKLTGETWIDGKPIYRKVINITNPVVQTDGTEVYNDIPINLPVETLINLDGKFYKNAAWYDYPYFIGTLATGNTKVRGVKLILINDGTSLRVLNSHTGYNNTSGYAIIEYTKTTD